MVRAGWWAGVLAVLGCAAPLHPPSSLSALEARAGLAAELVGGNHLEVVNNGEVFDVLEREIARAASSVHIVLFIWRPGEPSDRIVRTLVERVRSGVECRVIIDPFYSVGFAERIQPVLEGAGCQVHVFLPLSQVRTPRELVQRQHRKLVVVDGRVALTGGFGIWRSWLGNAIGKDEWRDVSVLFRGPVVAQAQQVFGRDWEELTGEPLPESAFPPLTSEGTARAMFIGSEAKGGQPSKAQRATDWLLHVAQRRVWIANSYFVPSDRLSELMIERAHSGVDVRVLAPGDTHDIPLVLAAQRDSYPRLLPAGVRIWEYHPAMMHSKVMTVDDRLSLVGSINLDPMSLRQARECALIADDPVLARRLAEDFLWDLSLSVPVRHAQTGPLKSLARRVMWFLGAM